MQLHDLNWVDCGILILMGISIVMGIFRGFVRETLSLVTWGMAVWVAIAYHESAAQLWLTRIPMLGVRLLVAIVLLVLLVLIIGGVLGYLITRLIRFTGFGVTDRIVGILFGFVRGAVLVALAVMIVTPTPFSRDKLWKESALVPRFEPLSTWLKVQVMVFMPEHPLDLLKKFQLDKL